MPTPTTYPGVYIEEIPSGVRTITGVATSITAFLGRAERGPVDEPVTINCFGDFERIFGGLGVNYPMSYTVRDFYLNGGSNAIIVRLFEPTFADEAARTTAANTARTQAQAGADAVATAAADAATADATAQAVADAANAAVAAASVPGTWAASAAQAVADEAAKEAAKDGATHQSVADAAAAAVVGAVDAAVASAAPLTKAKLDVNGLKLAAANEGDWGNQLRARVDHNVASDLPWITAFGRTEGDLFNLTVRDGSTGAVETFLNVTVRDSPRRVNKVLENQSGLVRVDGDLADDGIRPTNHAADPPEGKTVWDDNASATSTGVAGGGQAEHSQPLDDAAYRGSESQKTGIHALEGADLFNLLCIPPDTRHGDTSTGTYGKAMKYCVDRRAMLIVDPPKDWSNKTSGVVAKPQDQLNALGLSGNDARNAAVYFPRVKQADPLREGQSDTFVPCGIVAGLMARTDVQRGVWKAPAGIDVALGGVQALEVRLTDAENGILNPLGINCLRSFPVIGRVVWGARTLRGADILADDYKYVPVRRVALFIEESLYRGTQWAVFEPNDEPLWAELRLNIGAFMQNLFRQGAFQGTSPRDAYFVKCDKESTTQNDINLGIVNIVVGFAPLKPAEFVIIKIQQMAGQIET